MLSTSDGSIDVFQCSKITRCLPKKRISCVGKWKGETIFAKFFIAPNRAKIHWQKEKNGFELLIKKQIPAPHILHSGQHNEIYFILFEFLENTASLQDTWNNATETHQLQLLMQLTSTIADHHNKGILQQDLHLNNFLSFHNRLYTLDGADITVFDSSNQKIASNNLALLFAQFYPAYDHNIKLAVDHYASLRQWEVNPKLVKQISIATMNIREKRKQELLKKTRRKCSLFDFKHTWNQLTISTREHQSSEMNDFIQSPNSFITQGDLLKKGNTCTVAIVTIDNLKVVVKRYNIKNWLHFIRRTLRPSRAIKSWTNSHLLQFYGISTPEPIAVIEKRCGLLRKTAYFISKLSLGGTGDQFLQQIHSPSEEKNKAIQSMVQLVKNLHELKLTHGDLKASNFMISPNLNASLIDLDSMKQHDNQCSFDKAKAKDINRFLKNWDDDPLMKSFISRQLN